MRTYVSALALAAAIIAILAGCSPGPKGDADPRKAVLSMFRAIENEDRAQLAHCLDFESLLKSTGVDYALKTDSPRVFSNPEEILNDLLKGGLTNQRWLAMQRIVDKSTQSGDSALVDVSFVDKTKSIQYLNKFGLRKVNGVWKIYSFSVKNNN